MDLMAPLALPVIIISAILEEEGGDMAFLARDIISPIFAPMGSGLAMASATTAQVMTAKENYTQEVKIDKRGIEVSNSASSQRTVITNTEFAGYYNDEVIFTLNKDETQTKKTTVDGELTVGKTKFVPMPTASEGLNIVILD